MSNNSTGWATGNWRISLRYWIKNINARELKIIFIKMKFLGNQIKVKGKVFYGQEPPSGDSTATECGVNYQLLAVIYWSTHGELLVAVEHNQLRTMASETVDPINWLLPPPSWAVPPERLVHSINRCSAWNRPCNLQHARKPHCLWGLSWCKINVGRVL